MELAQQVVAVSAPGADIRVARNPAPGAPAPRYVPDTRRAESGLGLRAWIPLEEGIRRTYQWHAQTTLEEALCT